MGSTEHWVTVPKCLHKIQKLFKNSAPPTFADVNSRLFSTASHILNKSRNRLLPRNAEHHFFVHENIANVKYEYWFEYNRSKIKMPSPLTAMPNA